MRNVAYLQCCMVIFSNHSARKTSISTLLNNNVHPIHVSQLSGHKNIDNLRSYHTASSKQQEQMSDLISAKDDRPPLRNIINKKRPIPSTSTIQLSQQEQQIESVFCGANITNSVFNINIQNSYSCEKPAKRRRVIFYSDEE